MADLRFMRFAGFLAWIVWALVHIYFLIGFANRFFVLLQWGLAFVHQAPTGSHLSRAGGARRTGRSAANSRCIVTTADVLLFRRQGCLLALGGVTVFVTAAGNSWKPRETGALAKPLQYRSLRFSECLLISPNWIMSPRL